MKTGLFTPKPGDLFRWHYDSNDILCHEFEHMWSTPMKCYVQLQGINMLIALTETDIWWINSMRFLHSHVDDNDVAINLGDSVTRFVHARIDDSAVHIVAREYRRLHPRNK